MSRGKQSLSGRYQPQVPLRSEWLQNGWPNRDDQTISYANGSETFTIAPVGSYYDYYVEGRRHRSDGDTLVTDGTDGAHWIYYTAAGVLSEIVNPSHAQTEDLIENQCLVAMVYWNNNTSEGYLFDERHGMSLSRDTHRMLHECVGMQWAHGVGVVNILAEQSGALNSHAQYGNASGEVYDEDVPHDINAIASTTGYECWWWDGTRWQWDTYAGYPFLVGGTPRAQYNNYGAGTLVEIGNGNFCLSHLFATGAADGNPIVIVGQAEYANITAARNGAASEISALLLGTLPSPELKPIATVVLQSSNGYGNTPKTRTRYVNAAGDSWYDWRNNPLSGGGASAADHGSQGGLADDDHSGHPWLTGRAGGQVLQGGNAAGEALDLEGTSHATPGPVNIGENDQVVVEGGAPANSLFVETTTGDVGIGTATPGYPIHAYRSGANCAIVTERNGGAINYINSTATFGNFGTVNAYALRLVSGGVWAVRIDTDYAQMHRLPGPSSAGEVKWGYSGLDGTARTIIADDTPDVVTTCDVRWLAKENVTGTTARGHARIDNGGTSNQTVGGATIQFAVAANGALTVQRTAGANSVEIVCSVLFF